MTKKRIYHTRLQHSKLFVDWFKHQYRIDLKPLQQKASNAYDPACVMACSKMSKPLMWAIYYNVVSK
jgi:hypothetical protein